MRMDRFGTVALLMPLPDERGRRVLFAPGEGQSGKKSKCISGMSLAASQTDARQPLPAGRGIQASRPAAPKIANMQMISIFMLLQVPPEAHEQLPSHERLSRKAPTPPPVAFAQKPEIE